MNDAPMNKPAPQSGFVPPIDLGALGAAPSQQAPVNAYLHSRVMSARPEELRMMLLDAAVVAATQARDGLAAKDFERSFNGVSRCRDIIVELMSGVRDEPDAELAKNVRALYAYIFQELTEARSTKDAARMEKVVGLLEYERETWGLLLGQLGLRRSGAPQRATDAPLALDA